MVAVIQIARTLEAEHIAISEEDADGYNKRLILDWCDSLFGHLPWAFNIVIDSIERMVEQKVQDNGIVLPEDALDDATIEDLVSLVGLNAEDIAAAWRSGVEDVGKNVVECL